jgi:hypothetical protein
LTAKATDNGGASTVSAPVNIAVLAQVPPPPPPTNRPPVVRIVATDPVAIEGTNCWGWPGLPGPVSLQGMTNSLLAWSNWPIALPVIHFMTNCGPKNATLTLYRSGNTNGVLSVNYALGGTASNGVDYVSLPGEATFAAGASQALISVVPIDDGPPDVTGTVILTLEPSTNYALGYPARAAAIILDIGTNGPPPLAPLKGLAPTVLPDKCFHLAGAGPNGAWFQLEYSTNMVSWAPVCTNQVINGAIDFVDPDAQASQLRFYRAVPEANPAGQ